MTAPIEMPEGWDPRASLGADMSRAGEFDNILKRHGLDRAGQFKPPSPWDSTGKLRDAGAPPPPTSAPANGGIR